MTGPGEKLTVTWGVAVAVEQIAVAVKQVAIAGNIALDIETVGAFTSSCRGSRNTF